MAVWRSRAISSAENLICCAHTIETPSLAEGFFVLGSAAGILPANLQSVGATGASAICGD